MRPVQEQERQALVDRIVTSRQIARALRLRAFLLYVVERSGRQGAGNLREQEIGEAVFDREPNYDTSIDNIVRVNATELRKRLEQYFQEEGSQEELVLSIPRGSYVPVFTRRRTTASILDEPDLEPVSPELHSQADSRPEASPETAAHVDPVAAPVAHLAPVHHAALRWWLVAALTAMLMLGSVLFFRQHQQFAFAQQPWRASPELSRMWGSFFSGSPGLSIVTADTSFALAKDISGQNVTLDDYAHFRYGAGQLGATLSPDRRADLDQVLGRNTVSLGDVHTAQQVLRLNPFDTMLQLVSAREFTTGDMRDRNVVLIGSRQSNPWVDLFKDQVNFSLEYDIAHHQAYVVNRAPAAGEQAMYTAPQGGGHSAGYAVVALVPGLREGLRVLILGGTDAEATETAGEFVTTPAALAPIFHRMPAGKLLPFEVLLRTSQLTGTPLRSEVVAVRVARP